MPESLETNHVELNESTEDNGITSFTYERGLQTALISEVSTLFSGYKIFGNAMEGVEYLIEGKRIDLLLEHEESQELLAIELKAGIADFKVFGQISMYIGLLTKKFPDRQISGVIIAGVIDDSLINACSITNQVKLKTYQMKLKLDNA